MSICKKSSKKSIQTRLWVYFLQYEHAFYDNGNERFTFNGKRLFIKPSSVWAAFCLDHRVMNGL